MHITLPEAWTISIETIAGGILTLLLAAWVSRAAYGKVMGAIGELRRDVAAIKVRNETADQEAAAALQRQHKMEKDAAVMATQITALASSTDRIERSLADLITFLRKGH